MSAISVTGLGKAFGEHQPFAPINETLRGLLLGTHIGSDGIVAIAWCAAITAFGYVWSLRLFNRDPRPA